MIDTIADLRMFFNRINRQSNIRNSLYIHHTDAEHEWEYDRISHIGRLDKGLDEANEKGWTVVDMKNDWKVIYPFELKQSIER